MSAQSTRQNRGKTSHVPEGNSRVGETKGFLVRLEETGNLNHDIIKISLQRSKVTVFAMKGLLIGLDIAPPPRVQSFPGPSRG